MTKDEIFDLIVQHSQEVIPELQTHVFVKQDRLSDLGANSMDRADIIMMTLESLSLEIPLVELATVKDLGALADLLYEKLGAT
jgi:polyketide biosynthesis acyl carrier protein